MQSPQTLTPATVEKTAIAQLPLGPVPEPELLVSGPAIPDSFTPLQNLVWSGSGASQHGIIRAWWVYCMAIARLAIA